MPEDRVSGDEHRYYILAPEVPVPERTRVLKHDTTFALVNDFGDVDADARHEEGLYHDGTRYLSRYVLGIPGGHPLLLSSAVRRDNLLMSADLTNPDVYLQGRIVLPHGTLHIFRQKVIWQGACYERIHVRNFSRYPQQFALVIEYAADYVDIFEVRGALRARRGRMLNTRIGHGFAELGYEGLDGVTRRTRIECEPAPRHIDESRMQLDVHLEGRSDQVYAVTVSCFANATRPRRRSFDAALREAEEERANGRRFRADILTSHDQLNAWLQRSAADLNMLLTNTSGGLYPFAGVPWFDTTFGRDGIITALECLWLSPHIARGVLSFLAQTQATELDPQRDAEPGKILHEARSGEMAALGEIPFGRYYGSVDSTPLFIVLAGAYHRRTADTAFIESIWPHILAAIEWMDRYGDLDHDGFLEYRRHSPNGLLQQGWKDSHDSVFHADGRMAEGPIAICEAQSYAYAARLAAADLAGMLGQYEFARIQRDVARSLRERFQRRFWCEEIGVYALALDGDKRPCRVRSSNTGHCLFSGIAATEHAEAIIRSLEEDSFFSGWGIRTIADTEPLYNPMAYHNGSVWPHDNAIIAMGLTSMPSKRLAMRILMAQLDASTFFESNRLPELFCGFRRREGKAPTSYPVACSPQAWAAGAVFLILSSCLGLTIDALKNQIVFRFPSLPPNVERITIRDLTVGSASVDLTLHRYSGSVGLNVERRRGRVEVVMLS